MGMSTNDTDTKPMDNNDVFADPVAYLARFGIEATLVPEPPLGLSKAA
jgi:hypothetical protein